MDALSEVLKTVQIESTACYRLELSAPWAVQINEFNDTVFLAVVRGSIWLEVEGINTQMPLISGDLVVLPKGQRHRLRDSLADLDEYPNLPIIDFDDLLAKTKDNFDILRIGGVGLSTTIIYGRFSFSPLPENPLVSALPPLLVIKGEEQKTVEWLDTTLQFMASEMADARPGVQIVIDHLASILLVQAIRAYAANRECGDR
ncbi:MAG: cupin domain-containing protein, partial [Waterburya sp.]